MRANRVLGVCALLLIVGVVGPLAPVAGATHSCTPDVPCLPHDVKGIVRFVTYCLFYADPITACL
ncbi:MAG: hypothetical protein ACT4PT_04700 [Methanobacteriota archaeon]